MFVSSLSGRTPTPHRVDPPPQGWPPQPDDNVMDGWGARPLRWLSVLVLLAVRKERAFVFQPLFLSEFSLFVVLFPPDKEKEHARLFCFWFCRRGVAYDISIIERVQILGLFPYQPTPNRHNLKWRHHFRENNSSGKFILNALRGTVTSEKVLVHEHTSIKPAPTTIAKYGKPANKGAYQRRGRAPPDGQHLTDRWAAMIWGGEGVVCPPQWQLRSTQVYRPLRFQPPSLKSTEITEA